MNFFFLAGAGGGHSSVHNIYHGERENRDERLLMDKEKL